jgi:hypothetical protein
MPSPGEIIRASDVTVQACRVTRTSALSIPDNSVTTVAFNDEFFDNDGMHSDVTNNTRITIQTAGIYIVGFHGTLAALSTYTRVFAELIYNGSTPLIREQNAGTSVTAQATLNVVTMMPFDAGDYIEVQVYQDNTANSAQNLELTAFRSPEFWAARVGA